MSPKYFVGQTLPCGGWGFNISKSEIVLSSRILNIRNGSLSIVNVAQIELANSIYIEIPQQ